METVTVVGGGLAGLVAAIHLAEGGARVVVHEARPQPGGRALTARGPYRTNLGPHALYRHGPLEAWLLEQGLMPPAAPPRPSGLRLLSRDRLRRIPWALWPMARRAGEPAPADRDYRGFARERLGERGAEAAIGFAALPTFHGDPGALSAAFVQERIRRSLARGPVTYVLGGWGALVDALVGRARALGVEIAPGSKLAALPGGPTVVATDLAAARRLLGDASIDWPGPRTAMLDVALRRRRRDPAAVLDVDRRVYASRYTSVDPHLAPEGESLVQCAAGLRDGEALDAGVERIHAVLDRGFRDWRERTTWQHRGLSDGGAGAADPPGTTWRDRPAIARGDDVWLCGDRVAAPGVLSEVSFASAREAARGVLVRLRRAARSAA